MTKIVITEDIVYSDNSTNTVTVEVVGTGCCVTLHGTLTDVTWAQMADPAALSTLFAETTVRAFSVIVPLLGRVSAMQGIVA